MRIALTLEKLDPNRGGAEVATCRLVRELSQRGHEVHLFTTAVAIELPPGVQVHLLRVPWRFVAFRQISFANQIARRLRSERFDLSLAAAGRCFSEDAVWAQSGTVPSGLEGRMRRYYYNPLLRSIRRFQEYYNIRTFVYGALERRCFARRPPPYVIAPSRMVAGYFQQYYRVPPERLRVIPYQVDLNRFSPAIAAKLRASARRRFELDEATVAIACVAQNFRRKGIRPLIETTAELRTRHPQRAFRVLVAGSNARYAAPFEALARKLGCADRVRFLGHCPRIEELYAAADIFCLPTFADPCAIATIEAMARGLPTVTTRFNGASELIESGVTGYIVQNPEQTAELAGAIEPLFDAALRRQIGEAAAAAARRICLDNPDNEIARLVEDLAVCKQREQSAPAGP